MTTNGIISLTTHAGRAATVERVVVNLERQARPLGLQVCLSVQEDVVPLLPPAVQRMCNDKSVCLLTVERDFGSNMKYMVAMRRFPDLPVIVVDDDNIFHDGTLAGMMLWHRRLPSTILCRRYRQIAWGPDGHMLPMTFRSFPLVKCTSLPAGGTIHVVNGFPEHCAGCLYPPGSIACDEVAAEEAKRKAPHDDDVFAHVLSLRSGVETFLYHDPVYLAAQLDKVDPTLKQTGLWCNGGGGRRTTEALRRFEPELAAHRFDRP